MFVYESIKRSDCESVFDLLIMRCSLKEIRHIYVQSVSLLSCTATKEPDTPWKSSALSNTHECVMRDARYAIRDTRYVLRDTEGGVLSRLILRG